MQHDTRKSGSSWFYAPLLCICSHDFESYLISGYGSGHLQRTFGAVSDHIPKFHSGSNAMVTTRFSSRIEMFFCKLQDVRRFRYPHSLVPIPANCFDRYVIDLHWWLLANSCSVHSNISPSTILSDLPRRLRSLTPVEFLQSSS